jgi:MFS family permease
VVVALLTAIATIPSGILSNRLGRKPLIYVAAAVGSIGLVVAGLAPGPEVLLAGATLIGIGSGTFLAVDWALMTDIIPKAASGRYMGLSNVATQSSTTIAVIVGGLLIDLIARAALPLGTGQRVVLFVGVAYYILGALTLLSVVEPPRSEGIRIPSPA